MAAGVSDWGRPYGAGASVKEPLCGSMSGSVGPFERAGIRIAGSLLFGGASRSRPMPILIIGVIRSRTRCQPHDLIEHRHLMHLKACQQGPGLPLGGTGLHGTHQFRGKLGHSRLVWQRGPRRRSAGGPLTSCTRSLGTWSGVLFVGSFWAPRVLVGALLGGGRLAPTGGPCVLLPT